MKTGYKVVKHIAEGLKLLRHPDYGQQLWTIVKVRKHKKCIYLGVDLYGKQAYSPVTNGNNRMDRISIEAMATISLNSKKTNPYR